MRNKEKAWERREKRMHEISLLRSIPYSDHQRYCSASLRFTQVDKHSVKSHNLICLHSSLVVF
ncbi:hypothetical protein YC2023_062441 [Brassica napus]